MRDLRRRRPASLAAMTPAALHDRSGGSVAMRRWIGDVKWPLGDCTDSQIFNFVDLIMT
jgi:hypothetical protein